MNDAAKEAKAAQERQTAGKTAEQELQDKYKQVGITAVFAAANYVKPKRSPRAA